ncbi:related to putative N2,N2-dimethylguanosine tRNA methyltransferase [Cephalotrichum gorgonifer]|uniref:Related to putative N2,N2-dimethylguanosine tRNA methyltransferase n=1 Tax=Cephalotrichum gorgonifer TaxID=2041049 RepID=A0AAE8MZ02_9PEZI|nr:related to putative N2,N2-dimethylguanosine tRNA methyltransferase [Cephalotrichum gorgonifer]
MSVFDFPQLWERPPFEALLACLESLELKPRVWNPRGSRNVVADDQEATFADKREEAIYLSSIVKSGLEWIADDDKETLWDLASRRMSERSGRAGMGTMTRSWPFDTLPNPFTLTINEPAITGDSLGFKTWGSSHLLALHLPLLASTSLFRLFDESLGEPRPRILELGSGTGLLGLAAAATWGVHVTMSDLPAIVPNLAANAEANEKVLRERGASVDVGTLTWGSSDEGVDERLFGTPNQFKIVLAADPIYDDDHPVLLHDAISKQLSLGTDARAVVMVPKRDAVTLTLIDSFLALMATGEAPMDCLEHGELRGQDDWAADEDEEVKCWWGVFGRRKL